MDGQAKRKLLQEWNASSSLPLEPLFKFPEECELSAGVTHSNQIPVTMVDPQTCCCTDKWIPLSPFRDTSYLETLRDSPLQFNNSLAVVLKFSSHGVLLLIFYQWPWKLGEKKTTRLLFVEFIPLLFFISYSLSSVIRYVVYVDTGLYCGMQTYLKNEATLPDTS